MIIYKTMSSVSLLKIIRNRISYAWIILGIVLIVFSAIAIFLSFKFANYGDLGRLGFFISITCFYTLFLFVYSVKEIIRINHFFKHGLEAVAFVVEIIYAPVYTPARRNYIMIKLLSPWQIDENLRKDRIRYRYYIDNQIYECCYKYIATKDTIHLKKGSKINVLANPRNKNDAIIKDLFATDSS